METFLAEIDVDDIPSEQMQLIASYCGIDDALALMDKMPGLELYIPASAKKGFDRKYVKKHYAGFNAATVAGRLGLNREDVVRISKQPAPMNDKTLNSHLRLVSERCGDETAQRLAQNFPGHKFYIPINGLSIVYRKYIERSFNGTNTQELALRCKVSERYVRKVISEMYAVSAQLSLFDTKK
jgi:Mor family transcriptional regulator